MGNSRLNNFINYACSYLTLHAAWYMPCAVKRERWSCFFNIFSVDMWICFALSLVMAVITVSCISNYGHKSHLHESSFYSNIFSVTANIIAISLSMSVNTQPRSAPLHLFFLCSVCYSVVISTVFQLYLTTFLIEPGYEEPITTVEQMLRSERKFGFFYGYKEMFTDTSNPVDSAILKHAMRCLNEAQCFRWALVHLNFSTVLDELDVERFRSRGDWTDKSNRPFLCELEDGVVRTIHLAILVRKRSPIFEIIDDVIGRIVKGGIFVHMKKKVSSEAETD